MKSPRLAGGTLVDERGNVIGVVVANSSGAHGGPSPFAKRGEKALQKTLTHPRMRAEAVNRNVVACN